MGRKNLFSSLVNGDGLSTDDISTYRFPTVPSAIAYSASATTNSVRPYYFPGPGPRRTVKLTLTALSLTVADATVGVGVKLLDFLTGLYRIESVRASLTFTTTSVLADTLNASKVINWALGTATQTTSTLKGTAESDILPVTAATSSATVNVANTATHGERYTPRLLDGSSTAPDLYLNLSIPTAGDIDADATVAVDGTIELVYQDIGANSAPANADRMPTAALWANCPWAEILEGRVDGHVLFEDFLGNFVQAANVAASATTLPSPFAAFTGATAGGTVAQPTDEPYGVLQLNNTTDNETTCVAVGGKQLAGQWILQAGKRLWAETRVKLNTVSDTKLGAFIGFGEEGLCVTVGICAADDTLTDKDLVGFFHNAADGDQLDLVHNTASGGGVTTLEGDALATALAADTYTKLGIYCDGTTIFFYQDGTLLNSVALSATNVPDGEELCFYFAMTSSGGDDIVMEVDWLKLAQQRE